MTEVEEMQQQLEHPEFVVEYKIDGLSMAEGSESHRSRLEQSILINISRRLADRFCGMPLCRTMFFSGIRTIVMEASPQWRQE